MPPVPPPPQFSPLCSALSAWDGYLTICKVDMNGLFFFHLSFSSLGLSEGRSGRHTDGSNGRKDDSEGDVLSPNAPLIIQRNPKATVQKKKVKVSPGFSAAVTGEEGGSKRSVRHWRQKNHGVMTITSYSHDLWAQQSKV